jgi:hypothetical protein
MTLNLIEEKQIVRNIVELQPHRTYIHASAECSDLKSLGISAPGTYGEVSASNRGVTNKNYLLDFDKFSDYQINSSSSSRKTSLEALNDQNDERSSIAFEEEINNIGIFKDKTSQFKFGIEKVEQKYLIDDVGFYKKKSIKNLYKFYRENMRHRVFNPRWGFSNYNCLSFFNINNSKTPDKSHQNCLAYPNPYNENKNTYRFWDDDKLTISFYINQNNKNIEGYHFNPGCVLFIPGIIGIYIVKGSSVDESGLTNAYRLLVVYGDDLDKKDEIVSFVNENINSSGEIALNDFNIKDVSFYLSADNILKYNNWQNVTIVANKRSMSLEFGTKNVINTKIYIDGTRTISSNNNSSHHYPTVVGGASTFFSSIQESDSFVLVGNRYESVIEQKQDVFYKLFSNNSENNNDYIGPYVNKHISFGKILKDNYFVNEVTENAYSIKNNLKLNSGSYIDSDSGFGLTAEIHDIRIYNSIINNIKEKICKNSLKNFNDESLEFAVPVLCYEEKIKKKGIVNLKGISENNDDTTDLSNIDLSNIVLSSPINHYFSNKCLGHEVNVECFTSEFKNRVFPNCIFNDDIDSDQRTYDLFNCILYNLNSDLNEDLNEDISKGKSVNKLLYEFIAKQESSIEGNDSYYQKSLLYRNNFIMSCDNGLQNQSYENYYNSKNIDLHTDAFGFFDITHVSLNKTFNKEDVFVSNNIINYCGEKVLIDYTNDLGFIKEIENRSDFYIRDEYSKKFKVSYDILKNVSLNNYFRTVFHITKNESVEFKVYQNLFDNDSNFKLLDIGRNSFLKDLSNPACRKINDDYAPSVANHLAPFETKEVDLEEPRNYVSYFKHEMPIYNLFDSNSENFSKSFCVSTQMFGRRIEKESLELYDSDLAGTFGCKKVRLRDDGKGTVYRADAYTKHADWNYVGHCFYNEGIVNILHPSLENFGDFSIKVDFDASTKLNVLELNLPAYAGKTSKSRNNSYIENLRLNESAFNSDEDFVYISDINLHDENLNILAKAKIVKPHAKKDSDNVLFRIKMDY